MATGFVLDAATARALDDMFTKVYGPAASQIQKTTGNPWRGNMIVKLTEEIDEITPDSDAIPYKAQLVYLDSATGNYEDIDFVFDPDKNTEDDGVAGYVYEANGQTGLVDQYVIITFRGAPENGGSWQFDHVTAKPEIARLGNEVYQGLYRGTQLDDDLVANGQVYTGNANELPLLACLTGRKRLEAGEIVQVLRRGDNAYFEWNDPAMRNAGDDGSPPDNANGSFDPFAEDGGTVQGIVKNFNPDDGKFLFNRLSAKGSEGSGSDSTLGLSIKQASDYNWEIAIVGEDGEPYRPIVTPDDEVTCDYSMFFNRASRELILIQTDAELVEHECARVHIPCCDENGEETYNPDTPTEDPESPEDDPYDDDCPEPAVTLVPYDGICSPPSNGQKVADIAIQLNGNKLQDVVLTVNQVKFKGAVIDSPFAISANKKFLQWTGAAGVTGDVGDYAVRILATTIPCPTYAWTTDYVITIKDCDSDCDDPEEVTGGEGGGDACDESTAVVTITDLGAIPIVDTAPAERAVVTVSMNLDHGPSTLSGGSDSPAFGERTEDGASSVFRYKSSLNYTMLVPDSTVTKRENKTVQPTRNVTINAPRSTGPNAGTMKITYIGGSLKQASCRYVQNSWTYAPNGEATDGSPITSGQQYQDRSSVANGLITLSVDLITAATDPSPDRLVGRLGVDNPCTERQYSYAINGGAEAANFVIVGSNLYLKPTTDSTLLGIGTWEVTIDASHASAPTVSETFNLGAQAQADAVTIDNDIARGGQNEAIATITPVSGVTPVGGPMNYQATSYRNGEITDQQLFYIDSELNGDAVLRANVNLPAGSYSVRVAAQNQAMSADDVFVQQDIGIIIDKGAGQYIQPRLIGVV